MALGWSLAVAIYVTSDPVRPSDDVAEMQSTKRGMRDLERIGGKEAVLQSQLADWVSGLWRGQSLAYTTVAITLLAAGATWLFWPLDGEDDDPPE